MLYVALLSLFSGVWPGALFVEASPLYAKPVQTLQTTNGTLWHYRKPLYRADHHRQHPHTGLVAQKNRSAPKRNESSGYGPESEEVCERAGEFRDRETNNDPTVYIIEQDDKVLLRFLNTSLSGLASHR